MKILWITNSLFPEALSKLCGQNDLKGSGGWMLGLSGALLKAGKIKLTIAGVTPIVKKVTRIEGEQINYYAIPLFSEDRRYDKAFERVYRDIYNQVNPDVVHIHGTEFPHSLAALRACGSKNTVVSLQGLASVIARYYLAGLTKKDIYCNPTFHDFMRLNLFQQKREMEEAGRLEIMLFQEATNVIGRTTWDRTHVWATNPKINYFHCDEILREEFYDGDVWSYNNCKPHSIFLSQGRYPLKGLHKMLEAMPLILRSYPDASLRVAGPDITYRGGSIKDVFRMTTYGRIIRKLIKQNHLDEIVFFTGSLNAEEMKKEYLCANVFVCPSSIENSPNSLCEAQILGVPVLASYAGGIPDLMKGDEEHLYRFDEVEMLAKRICDYFGQKGAINTLKVRENACDRHDKAYIVQEMLKIYAVVSNKAEE